MKPLFIISCPIDTYSGYGARSRDLVRAIIELKKNEYDIKILPQRWGNCPWNFIKDHKDEWGFLSSYLLPFGNQLPKQPEIWAQVTVPNEFQPMGSKFNIGFTAGIETTLSAPQWIEGLNRMDLNIVSSKHAKETFERSKFEQRDNNNNIVGKVELQKPIEVLLEGADLTKYFPSKEKSSIDLSGVKESFAYLFVGHWMNGNIGEDRKNVGLLIKLFFETFKNQKKTPALILKCSGAGASYLDRDAILHKIAQIKSTVEADIFPNVYLLHGEFSDKEMNDLYNHKKIKTMISLTKGEGFGRPLLEFSLTKKPIICTNWSGHTDFLDSKFTSLISGEIKQVHESAVVKDMILPESGWFAPNTMEVTHHMLNIFNNYNGYKKGAMLQYHKSKNNFSFGNMKDILDIFLLKIPEIPQQVKLKLPKIKKIELPKLKKLEDVKG